MGRARNNGAGSWVMTRWRGRKHPQVKGVPVPGTGVSHWHREGTGSNKAGLLSGKVPWDGAKEAKYHDAEKGVNNTARRQAIAEGVTEQYEDEFTPAVDLLPEPGRHEVGYDWDPADLPPGVTFNGMSAEEFEEPYHYDYQVSYDDHAIDTINRLREQVRNLGGVPVA